MLHLETASRHQWQLIKMDRFLTSTSRPNTSSNGNDDAIIKGNNKQMTRSTKEETLEVQHFSANWQATVKIQQARIS